MSYVQHEPHLSLSGSAPFQVWLRLWNSASRSCYQKVMRGGSEKAHPGQCQFNPDSPKIPPTVRSAAAWQPVMFSALQTGRHDFPLRCSRIYSHASFMDHILSPISAAACNTFSGE